MPQEWYRRPASEGADQVPPADPWAGRTREIPVVQRDAARHVVDQVRPSRRPVFGWVYELFTDDPRDGEHPYVGQVRAPRTIVQRKREHQSAGQVDRDSWKARILDGPRGHRLLETVYKTGDDYLDQRELDRVEAFWIDRLKTTHNIQRPARPRAGDPVPARPRGRGRATRRPARRPARRRPFNWRLAVFLMMFLLATAVVARGLVALHLPAPWVPWVLSLPLGAFLAWAGFGRLLKVGRKLKVVR